MWRHLWGQGHQGSNERRPAPGHQSGWARPPICGGGELFVEARNRKHPTLRVQFTSRSGATRPARSSALASYASALVRVRRCSWAGSAEASLLVKNAVAVRVSSAAGSCTGAVPGDTHSIWLTRTRDSGGGRFLQRVMTVVDRVATLSDWKREPSATALPVDRTVTGQVSGG